MKWILATLACLFILRFLWKNYIHRSNVMARQAANMNWVAIGRVPNIKGWKDVLLGRNGLESKIDWKTGEVWLVKPEVNTPFEDYLALERWLALKDRELQGQTAAYQLEYQAFANMAKAQEKAFAKVQKQDAATDADDEELDPDLEKQVEFQEKVRNYLREGPGGDDLVAMSYAYGIDNPNYLLASIELVKTAMEFGVSPIEVATVHIMAFTASAEVKGVEPTEGAAVYLAQAAEYMREHGGI